MKTVTVNASTEYDILIDSGILDKTGKIVKEKFGLNKICIITDDVVDGLYGERTVNSFKKQDFNVEKIVIQHGEQSKNTENLIYIVRKLAKMNFTRNDMLVALGGGVVGDLCGFCAATYMRGIRFIQMPTTLLAAVDSSVGGKCAVDLPEGKNLFGAFWQPSLVICDTDTLKTLTKEIYADGCAEIIKYGMIYDKNLFEMVKSGVFDHSEVIARCVQIKRDIVNQDEFDTGLRQILNFGHTFGHGIEILSAFKVSHGMGVAIGMSIITNALKNAGLIDESVYNELVDTLKNNNLPTNYSCSPSELFEKVIVDKKRVGECINVILVKAIGQSEICKMELDKVNELIKIGIN